MKNTIKIKNTKKKVEAVHAKVAVSSESVRSSALCEVQEQESRKSNVVIHNLEESIEGDANARRDHDLSLIRNIAEAIGLDGSLKDEIRLTRRLDQTPTLDPTNP